MATTRPCWHELKPRRLFPVLCAVAFCAAALLVGYWLFMMSATADPMVKEDLQTRRGFQAIKAGMTRQEVINHLGQPHSEGTEFHLSQYGGFEQEYERATRSGSSYYLFWLGRRNDLTYAVGFSTNDTVIMKSVGGS